MQENNFQEQFLTELCAERQPVSVFLVSGIQLKGQIIGFDQYVIILKKEKVLQTLRAMEGPNGPMASSPR